MNQFLNYSVVWFQILNLFLVLLLSSFTSNSLLAPEENRKNNVHIAIDQIKSAAVRSKTWNLEHIKPDHKGRTSAELEQRFFFFTDQFTSIIDVLVFLVVVFLEFRIFQLFDISGLFKSPD